jgi:hypothetical protein
MTIKRNSVTDLATKITQLEQDLAGALLEDRVVEIAAHALERAANPQWTDAEFEIWWNKDPLFVTQHHVWSDFEGTRKAKRLHQARIVLQTACDALEIPDEAADEIERLRTDFAKLCDAIRYLDLVSGVSSRAPRTWKRVEKAMKA